MNVSVFGLGYVGCVSAACLASKGHRVMGVDINIDKVNTVNNGRSPIIELGLEELIKMGRDSGNLKATQNVLEAVTHADILLICVGTPSDSSGNLNFKYIDRICVEIGQSLRDVSGYKVIAVRSTLLPGVITQRVIPLLVKESGKQAGEAFGVASNPEFLREGSAIADFEHPPFTLIGAIDKPTGETLEKIYQGIPAPVFHTVPDTACMVKYACNAFHGLKVVFANEIGQLCKKAGVDGTEVMKIFCQDTSLNISPRYLMPGFAFGGSCLPKDLRALVYLSRHSDLQLPVLESILPSNRLHIQKVVDMILSDYRRHKVGVVGLTFKPGTDDLRESPIVELVEILSGKGLEVRIYDNNVSLSRLIGGNKAFIEQVLPHISTMLCDSMEDIFRDSDAIVIGHDMGDEGDRWASLLKPDQLVIDLVRVATKKFNLATYEGICW